MDVKPNAALRIGDRVLVPWGLNEPRLGVVVEVWGNPHQPSHLRVQLVESDEEDELSVLLLDPASVTPAA